jgi:hypothetical protein
MTQVFGAKCISQKCGVQHLYHRTGGIKNRFREFATNCRVRKFQVQDVYRALVDDGSFGCKIYNSANPAGG